MREPHRLGGWGGGSCPVSTPLLEHSWKRSGMSEMDRCRTDPVMLLPFPLYILGWQIVRFLIGYSIALSLMHAMWRYSCFDWRFVGCIDVVVELHNGLLATVCIEVERAGNGVSQLWLVSVVNHKSSWHQLLDVSSFLVLSLIHAHFYLDNSCVSSLI